MLLFDLIVNYNMSIQQAQYPPTELRIGVLSFTLLMHSNLVVAYYFDIYLLVLLPYEYT